MTVYFFYFDEAGTRDPEVTGTKRDGTVFEKDPLYVLTAVGLYERKWVAFDQEISALKDRLRRRLRREKGLELPSLADCEVKSTALRIPKETGQKGYSRFVHSLEPAEKTAISELFLSQLGKHNMALFAAVIDKRKLHGHMTSELLHKKAYELVLERIEHFLYEYHRNHSGVIVMDDTQRELNHAVAMKHAQFQREGNINVKFKHIVEYPFFTDSKLSNGVQLADICSYIIYRGFRAADFTYAYFDRILPFFYRSQRTARDKLDGLKVFPDESELVSFAQDGFRRYLHGQAERKRPADNGGPSGK